MGCAQGSAAIKVPASPWQTTAVQAMSKVRDIAAQNETCRQFIRTTADGSTIRLRLSNAMSPTPLSLSAITAGIRLSGAALVGPPALVTVGGSPSVTIAPHRVVTTDPVQLPITTGQEVAVTFAVSGTAKLTEHLLGAATGWCSGPGTGDHTADPSEDPFGQESREGLVVESLEVKTSAPRPDGVLAVGDSLTDAPLPPDTYQRWTDFVAADTHRAVGNAAIGGNRVILSGGYGPTLTQRFSSDVLSRPGVATLVLFAGTNDVSTGIDAARLTRRLSELCRRARARGLRVVLVTLPPAWKRSADKEQLRQQVNQWIRTTREADAYVDADTLLRDPARPTHLRAVYDFGDGLHISAAGHRVLGQAIGTALSG
ncbi:MAG: hypothetical protein QOJ79_1922 [Actinomycetota bacterium]|jgi:lysophospholipase L1-like esterase|nr:hypothetical protein [Actinomycetota bacterium]